MEKAKITVFQFYALMVLFGLGGSTVIGLGSEAKQDAWISIIIGNILGIILFLLYGLIIRNYPNLTLIEIIEKIFGKVIGKIVGLIYILYYIFFGTILFRDIIELIVLYVLSITPVLVIGMLACLVITYALFLGIENIARFGVIIFALTVPLKLLFCLTVLVTDIVHFDNIFPLVENGWLPILKTAFPTIITTPFSQLFIFLMLIPYVNDQEKVMKAGILAYITTGFILVIITLTNIFILGPLFIELALFPTIQMVRLINIYDFIQRVEGLAVFTFLTCGFTKVIIYAYTASIGFNILVKTKKYQLYIIPVVFIILIGSITYTNDLGIHLKNRIDFFPLYINTPIEIILPILFIILIYIKKLIRKLYSNT